jgi:hypothetical protein
VSVEQISIMSMGWTWPIKEINGATFLATIRSSKVQVIFQFPFPLPTTDISSRIPIFPSSLEYRYLNAVTFQQTPRNHHFKPNPANPTRDAPRGTSSQLHHNPAKPPRTLNPSRTKMPGDERSEKQAAAQQAVDILHEISTILVSERGWLSTRPVMPANI